MDLKVAEDQSNDKSHKKQELQKFYNDMSITNNTHSISGFKVVGTRKQDRGYVRQKIL